jgi:hypothetical protein
VTIRKGSTAELYEKPMMSGYTGEIIKSRGESKIYVSKLTRLHHVYGPKFSYSFRLAETSFRQKDVDDLYSALPEMPEKDKSWFIESLQTECPDGHEWIHPIEKEAMSH